MEVHDQELVVKFLSGCFESADQLVERYEHRLYNLSRLLTGCEQSAEEILTKVFCDFFLNPIKFSENIGFALSRAIVTHSLDKMSERPATFRLVIKEGRQDIETELLRLPECIRVAFVMKEIAMLSPEAIAVHLSISVDDVSYRVSCGRRLLRRALLHSEALSRIQGREEENGILLNNTPSDQISGDHPHGYSIH